MSFNNASRGLQIADTAFEHLTKGAYGLIFIDRTLRRVRKVYRRQMDADEAHCTAVFDAETQAFELAISTPAVRALVPQYFGRNSAGRLVDRDGKDVTGEIYADLSFEAEFLEGAFEKIGGVAAPERERITSLFHAAGIRHMTDASVRITNGVVDKVIDFAVQEIELSW
jgi:hypothetical protein